MRREAEGREIAETRKGGDAEKGDFLTTDFTDGHGRGRGKVVKRAEFFGAGLQDEQERGVPVVI